MPLLVVQGWVARRRAVPLPEPEGARSGARGRGADLRLLVLGDSSALGIGVAHQDAALLGQVLDRLCPQRRVRFDLVAVSGARTADALGWLDDLPEGPFDVVITALGVNDVTKLVPRRRFVAQQRALLTALQAQFGAGRIVVSGLPHVHEFPVLPQPLRGLLGRRAARFDAGLQAVAAGQPRCVHIAADMTLSTANMSPDGFHPGPPVYAAWADKVAHAVRDLVPGEG